MEVWFSKGLIDWYRLNKRDLPWRKTSDPYKIWLSEVILQQTQVVQGLGYYIRFIEKYPTIIKLAEAPEDEVLKLWEGLGYYSRARNMHAAAKWIVEAYKGKFPNQYEQIRELKGVGDYTAAAIASFSFNLPYAVVDGNVYRVLSRLFGIVTPIDTPAGKKEFAALAQSLLNKKKPAEHNQAIMEFGSQFCKVSQPNCLQCIFTSRCFAYEQGKVNVLPLKERKTKIKKRYLNYLVLVDENRKVVIHKRQKKDIWQGLYEFVLVETEGQKGPEIVIDMARKQKLVKGRIKELKISQTYKHVLSHQHLFVTFYILKAATITHHFQHKISISDLNKYAFPVVMQKFLKQHELKEIV